MTVEIRPASIDADLDGLVELTLVVQELHVQWEPAAFRVPQIEEVAAWFEEVLSR